MDRNVWTLRVNLASNLLANLTRLPIWRMPSKPVRIAARLRKSKRNRAVRSLVALPIFTNTTFTKRLPKVWQTSVGY